MNNKENSVQILVVAISAALLSTALVSLPIGPSAAQQIKAADEINERKQGEHHEISTEQSNSGPTAISLMASDDNLNQTKVNELKIALHDLWIQHIVWTRLYIVAAAADQPDASFAAERLLKNQEDIGNAVKPFYGEQVGNQLTAQLKEHITIAVGLLKAAKAGNNTALGDTEEKWYANADQIATFLSMANPNWKKEDLLSMLNEHLSLTKKEAVSRLTGDYATDVTTFDALYKHATSMADEFTVGIVKQFQDQFI